MHDRGRLRSLRWRLRRALSNPLAAARAGGSLAALRAGHRDHPVPELGLLEGEVALGEARAGAGRDQDRGPLVGAAPARIEVAVADPEHGPAGAALLDLALGDRGDLRARAVVVLLAGVERVIVPDLGREVVLGRTDAGAAREQG